ncbi:hypothetical protein H113_05191 [Trichophyton rubrum MR1459]|nr:uncharacterized protein TERG_02892 [Trichophyton rubrum CBS 118892]EGD86635.2 hypothetical protein TERG_02892 [Trichophyton rubrum CBS 118892]EZF94271.1 hypothetical protein H113_05191 [Trichophyton rubrum MR1459]EZG05246.1 hypothetical protein H106_04990 [Trichophyton rubrum CBS 735.88]
MSFIFNSSSGNVGEPLKGQLVLQSDCIRKSSPIHLSEVKIAFEGGLPPIRILADSNAIDASKSTHTHASISLADGQSGPSSSLQEIKGNANLSLFPGQMRAFTLTLIPREASDVRVASITLMVADDKFDLAYTISSTSNDAYALPRWWTESKGSITSRRIGKGRDPSSCQILPKPPKVLISVPGLRDAYYFGEKAGLNIRLDNNEDASASIVVELKLSGRSEYPAVISWLDGADVEGHSEETEELSASQTKEAATQTIRRKIAELGAGEHTILPAMVVEAPHPIQYDLEISVSYHLSSDPEAAISKAISLDLPFIQPFEANHNFLPRLHLSPWPDFFNIDESEASNMQQRWLLNSTLMPLARETLVIEDVKLRVVAVEVGKICSITTASDSSKQSGNRYIRPEEPQSTDFMVVIERLAMEDRLQTGVSFELKIKWRRDEQQDVFEAETTSPEISLPTESVITSLTVPRFSIPMSEPRVLASLGAKTSRSNDVPGLIQLNYTLENPSMHFLTFNLTMETSDQFAFSGPKSMTLRLVPLSRHTLQYSLLATRRGVWIQPQLVIVDTYFNKTLRILPTESIKSDAKGILIWVD